MTGKTIQHLLYTLLAIVGIIRRSKCLIIDASFEEDGSDEDVNDNVVFDESRYFAALQRYEDMKLQFELLDRAKAHGKEKKPYKILYQTGNSESELPMCENRYDVCSKVDLYGPPLIERQCRCTNGHACPSNIHEKDGYTVVDKTRLYKVCEPVKRLPICRYFRDITWTLVPGDGPHNRTIQRLHCRCQPGSVQYLIHRLPYITPKKKNKGYIYAFACSPQTKLQCKPKEPCRLFTVRKRHNSQLEEVTASPICQCLPGYRCPERHTDSGVSPARSYNGVLVVKTYSANCIDDDWNELAYD